MKQRCWLFVIAACASKCYGLRSPQRIAVLGTACSQAAAGQWAAAPLDSRHCPIRGAPQVRSQACAGAWRSELVGVRVVLLLALAVVVPRMVICSGEGRQEGGKEASAGERGAAPVARTPRSSSSGAAVKQARPSIPATHPHPRRRRRLHHRPRRPHCHPAHRRTPPRSRHPARSSGRQGHRSAVCTGGSVAFLGRTAGARHRLPEPPL